MVSIPIIIRKSNNLLLLTDFNSTPPPLQKTSQNQSCNAVCDKENETDAKVGVISGQ